MATSTTNFALTKPGLTDPIDVSVLNTNFDIIDRQMKLNQNMAASATTTTPSRATISLTDTWTGSSSPYTQTVTVSGATITSDSKVDLLPDATVLAQMIEDGTTAMWIQNDNGVLTAYAMGTAPTVALTVQCTVSTTNTSVTGISITSNPTKGSYYVGDTLDLTGLAVTATYADGTTANVTADCIITPADGSVLAAAGTQTISISYLYAGITRETSTYVLVNAVALTGIEVTTLPTKRNYVVGEPLDLTGIVVTGTFNNETTSDVTSQCTFNPANGSILDESGTITVNVSCTIGEYTNTTSFTVASRTDNPLTGIAVTTEPTKTVYTVGENLDLAGIVVTATYQDETTADVTSSCVFSPVDGSALNTEGSQAISIAYSEGDVTQVVATIVTVNAAEEEGDGE